MKTNYDVKMKTINYVKLLAFAICALLMLIDTAPVFAAPGDPCTDWRGRAGQINCRGWCSHNANIANNVGNGNCQRRYNCAYFGYDGGDCWDCYVDADGDGYGSNTAAQCGSPNSVDNDNDCDDGDADRYPGNAEICDGKDNDCDGRTDEGLNWDEYWPDSDGDGYGNRSGASIETCDGPPSGYVDNDLDCDDSDPDIYWGHAEICDGKDNDCDGNVDEGLGSATYYADNDGDGYGDSSDSQVSCSGTPSGYVTIPGDCDDNDADRYPGNPEVCDGKDNDCANGVDDGLLTTYYRDADGDSYGNPSNTLSACSGQPTGYVSDNTDCDDGNAAIHPGAAEECDAVDHNCQGGYYDGLALQTYYRDADGDNYGDSSNTGDFCSEGEANNNGYIAQDGDCDDSDPAINPDAIEVCDGIDNNCIDGPDDGLIFYTYFRDVDGDGFGNPADSTATCMPPPFLPAGYISDDTDCDDSDVFINPAAQEICGNGVDEDCSGADLVCNIGDDCNCQIETVYVGGQPVQQWVCYGQIDCNGDCQEYWQIDLWEDSVDCDPELQCDFYNWDAGNCAIIADCYEDLDGDGYGNPSGNTMTGTCAAGFVDNYLDCDDMNAAVNPDGVEICDNLDNNCDGDVDEGLTLFTYYLDSDGDGFGNPVNSMAACSPPPNYVSDNTDCSDNNALIHPGAYDLCQNGVDEDCNGADRICGETPNVCADLSDIPLETQVESAPPIVMLLVDDSGSMAWSTLCPNRNGKFYVGNNAYSNYYDVDPYWKSQWSSYNGIYYNPEVDYFPWPDSATTDYEDADPDDPRSHPNYTNTRDLNNAFISAGDDRLDGVNVRWAHYYAWSTAENAPYLVNITGSNGSYSLEYYKVTNCDNGECTNNQSYVNDSNGLTSDGTPPADVVFGRTAAEERQNFANWYQYFRTRQLTAISALANVVNSVQGMKIGLHSVNHSVNMITPRLVENYRGEILDDLYDVAASGGTPLRRGLRDVGNYYADEANGPYSNSSNGGDCQQAYTIMMTDGYWNGSSPNVGNTDADGAGPYDGGEFGDTYSDTLADVAMKYYEVDLNSNLADIVPTSSYDNVGEETMHQHMVTYSVSFGLTGLYNPDDYPSCPDGNCPAWPNVTSSSEDERSITDLWHAAVNGRGRYMEATNAQQLAYALIALMQDVTKRNGSGASVAVNSHELRQGSKMYQGSYNSAGWTGDVKAYAVNHLTGQVDNPDSPAWSAAAELDDRVSTSGHTDRNIYTMGANNGVEFTYGNIGSLSNFQQESLGADAVAQENMINFIRGDFSNDENHNGGYRSRISRLGDIIHSEPKFVNNYLYVGGNDGMLHVFSAATGEEIFAYVPSFVYGNLDELANPDYTHRYFVDLSPFLGYDNSGNVLLVGGLGKGGKGYYCLDIDIVNPGNFSASDVKWEYPDAGSSAAEFANLGYTYSEPAIITTESAGNILIFGNGYDSTNARAVLYALDPATGNMLNMIDTGVGSPVPADNNCNGLTTPVYIDSNNNGRADYAYAGDLKGNVWKFDISGTVDTWNVVYNSGGSPRPFFQARDASGNPQPITTRVAVTGHCIKGYAGYIVIFGTGKFNSSGDFTDTSTQSVYGIWDWGQEWIDEGGTGSDKYFGVFNSPGAGRLSNLSSHSDLTGVGDQLNLLYQGGGGSSVSFGGESWGVTTSNEINWFNVEKFLDPAETYGDDVDEGYHVGWTYTLPHSGERVVADPVLWMEYALIVSQEPAESMCVVGGTAYLSAFNICSGAAPDEPFFDTNNDAKVDDDDEIVSKVTLHDFVTYSPTQLGPDLVFGPRENYTIVDYPKGILFWRFFNMN